MNLYQVAEKLARRLTGIFLCDQAGRWPVYGGNRKFQKDPYWRDYIPCATTHRSALPVKSP